MMSHSTNPDPGDRRSRLTIEQFIGHLYLGVVVGLAACTSAADTSLLFAGEFELDEFTGWAVLDRLCRALKCEPGDILVRTRR